MHEPKKSKVKGVSFVRTTGKWRARIKINGKSILFGTFLTEAEAITVLRAKSEELGIPCKPDPFIRDGYGYIPLTRGLGAIVDIEDFEELSQYQWSVAKGRGGPVAKRTKNGKHVQLHREIMGFPEKKIHIDHINHNTLDNRKANLRVVTCSKDNMNKEVKSDNKSGYIGVNQKGDKWSALITVDGNTIDLGVFYRMTDAVSARKEAELRYFGRFSYQG